MIKNISNFIVWLAMVCAMLWVTNNIFVISDYVRSEWFEEMQKNEEAVGIIQLFQFVSDVSFVVLVWTCCCMLILIASFLLMQSINKVLAQSSVLALEEDKK